MSQFQEARKYAHCNNSINDQEFLLLCNLNTSTNLDLEQWLYPKFYLEAVSSDDLISKSRFQKCTCFSY